MDLIFVAFSLPWYVLSVYKICAKSIHLPKMVYHRIYCPSFMPDCKLFLGLVLK